jgi:uncharacterized protein (DUF4415 family)
MTGKKRRLGSNLDQVDAHVIQPHEYDEAPEWTGDDFARADVYEGDTLVRRGAGRPKLERPKQQITVRLDSDILDALRATGQGWQSRLNEAAREWLERHRR